MKVIGLTGGSGTGKTLISEIMSEYGAFIINADDIAHQNLMYNNEMINKIKKSFGLNVIEENGFVNRKELGKIVFKDKLKLEELNNITHYYIIEDIKKTIENNKNKFELIVIDAPLLIETNLHKLCDYIFIVYADFNTRVERLLKRDNKSRDEIINRLNSQTSFEEIKKYADFIIENNNNITLKELQEQIIKLLDNL